MDLKLEGEGHL